MYNNTCKNISISGGIFRVTLSVGLILVVMNSNAPLNDAVYLAFVSIYAGITGFIGWDPVNAIMDRVSEKLIAKNRAQNTRLGDWATQ